MKDVAIDGHSDIEKSKKFIERIQLIHQTVQDQLEKSQGKYKARHDKRHVDHEFEFGDKFWLQISKERLQGKVKN